jgi:predicted aminopeptidase
VFAELQADYAALRERWGGFAGYDRWFAQPLTTAHLASVATYNDLVPAFEALFHREAQNPARFHAAVEALSRLPAGERRQALSGFAHQSGGQAGKIDRNAPALAGP